MATYAKLYKELARQVEKDFGKRCKEYALGCIVCDAWSVVDGVKTIVDFNDPDLWKDWKPKKTIHLAL